MKNVIVIGAGGAGLMAALNIAKNKDINVVVVTKIYPVRSQTGLAKGGINSVLKTNSYDSAELHCKDTILGSDFLADQKAVEFFTANMEEVIYELDSFGANLDKSDNGEFNQRSFGGASVNRTCFNGDKTGHVILQTLYEQCLKEGIKFINDAFLLDLVVDNKKAVGVILYHMSKGQIITLHSNCIIIATGGYARIFGRTTNGLSVSGDGIVAAMKVGIGVKDMEFVQFHPTGLFSNGVLLSEACRGEGGVLLNKNKNRFMFKYAKEKGELAARDIVSRAIELEIKNGNGFGAKGEGYVHIDMTHLGEEVIRKKLPEAMEMAKVYEGIDIIKKPIPIRPSCHYTMGGIDVVDYKTSETEVEGVFAIGECACISVHGANRLGGNSLAEVILFGKTTGEFIKNNIDKLEVELSKTKIDLLMNKKSYWENKFQSLYESNKDLNIKEKKYTIDYIRCSLENIMWNKVGIFRREKELKEAIQEITKLNEIYNKYITITNNSLLYNKEFIEYVEVGNMLELGYITTMAALWREESRGSHYRLDYEKRNDENFLKHSLIKKINNEFQIGYKNVDVSIYPLKTREY